MCPMKRCFVVAAMLFGALAAMHSFVLAGGHPSIDVQQGWRSLFNGRDLTNWQTVQPDGRPAPRDTWTADQGELTDKGYIWLQDHPGEIWFRNIYIKPLE